MFGKRGRPPEDRLGRQYEIYQAVTPLLLTVGARRLSMRDAAHAACMSIGGLYHYFPTKRELVLHGLNLEARSRICAENGKLLADLRAWDVERYLANYTDLTMTMLRFMRPAVLAALELGVDELQDQLDAGLTYNVTELVDTLRALDPGLPDERLAAMGRAIRRIGLGALIDRHTEFDEVREQLQALLRGYLLAPVQLTASLTA